MSQLISIASILAVLALTSAKSVEGGLGYGIIGGELADITELPHQVYVQHPNYYGVWCGGSIISPQHILTEASCIGFDRELKFVIAATANTHKGGDKYEIAKITEYPNHSIIFNIAVIKLTKEIIFSDKAKPIALAGPKYRIKDGAELIASGWGQTDTSPESDLLMKVTIAKVSDDECKDAFANFNSSEHFCAGGKGKKACVFDTGGPLIEKTGKGNVLVGVIQSGDQCNGKLDKRTPTLFTRVSKFNKWIKKVVKEDLESDE